MAIPTDAVGSARGPRDPVGPSGAPTVLDRLRDHRMPIEAVGIYLVIRIVGLLVLARFAELRGTSVGGALSVWDGQWMLAIAEHGYGDVPSALTDANGVHTGDTAYAFFPGYPLVVGLVAKLPLVSPYGAAVGLNLIFGSIAAVGAARLGALCAQRMADRSPVGNASERAVGLFTVAIFAATPMSVVLNMAYTEALFCMLAVWALVGVLEGRWLLAASMACLAGTVRPTAVVVIGVVMLAAAISLRRRAPDAAPAWPAWAALVISPLGYLAYLAVVWAHTGSPTGWFRIQTDGWGTTFDWGATAFHFINEMLIDSGEVAPVATSWIVLGSLLMVAYAIWSRLPWPVLVYGALVVAQVTLSSGLMMSRPRLLLPTFVLLIPLAIGLARLRPVAAGFVLLPIVVGSSWFGAHMLTVFPHAM